jgi:hypothetical protein
MFLTALLGRIPWILYLFWGAHFGEDKVLLLGRIPDCIVDQLLLIDFLQQIGHHLLNFWKKKGVLSERKYGHKG